MQHLDEGMIHTWLDGALSADEAARVSAHIEECSQCAAAVAEARGFIAGSSRILTALDNVPKGVVPIGARPKPRNWAAWRAAAAVLVVALGSFAVLRERTGTRSSAAEIAPFREQTIKAGGVPDHALTDSVQRESLPVKPAPRPFKVLAGSATPRGVTSSSGTTKMGNREPPAQDNVSMLPAAPGSSVLLSVSPQIVPPAGPPVAVESNPVAQSAGAVKSSVHPLGARADGVLPSARPSSAAIGAASASPNPIRIAGVSVAKGEVRISYEVAPGDTVVLAEVPGGTSSDVVVTGMSTVRTPDTSSTPRIVLRGATTMSTMPDTQNRKAAFRAQAATPRPPSAETLNGVTTLTWIDPATGSVRRLSGRHTAAELLDIKRGIEQLHAAGGAEKKP